MSISKLSKEQIIYNITYIFKNSKNIKEAEEVILRFLDTHLENK